MGSERSRVIFFLASHFSFPPRPNASARTWCSYQLDMRCSRSLFALFSFFSLAFTGSAEDLRVTDFNPEENETLGWQVVDDGVMGGLSQGKVSFEDGILRFGGNLSLENNGGFSSLRTKSTKLDLSDYAGLKMRVKGDGRTYQVRIASDARYRGMEVSFAAEFSTKKDKWIEVKVPFSELTGSWRGRSLKEEVFNPAKIQRLGLILADKKPGNFQLHVDWISAYSGSGTIVDLAIADGRFKTLAAALGAAELVEPLQGAGPLTVFAPTDEAFAKLPKGTVESLLKPENRDKLQAILKYHVVAGEVNLADALGTGKAATLEGQPVAVGFSAGKVLVNGSTLVDADLKASNGLIHVIDTVLLPPADAEPKATSDILGVAKSAGNFKTLLAAVEAAELGSVLGGDGPFTVFAPTDEAFADVPKETIEALLKPENIEQLKSLLTYHVVAGKVSAGDALNAKSAETVNGGALKFLIRDGKFQVNSSTIRVVDIECDNGVIHVIDSILSPPSAMKAASISPAKQIEDAIVRGVPAFNTGDTAKCAKIYQQCLESLTNDKRVKPELRAVLNEALEKGGEIDSAREQAWLFRQALDLAYLTVSRE